MLGVDAQELVFPRLDLTAQGLLEAETLIFPLLGFLTELRDQFGLVLILRRVRGGSSSVRGIPG